VRLRTTHRGPGGRPLALVGLFSAAAVALVAAALTATQPADMAELAEVATADGTERTALADGGRSAPPAPTAVTERRVAELEGADPSEQAPTAEVVAPSPTRVGVPALGVEAALIDLHKRADDTLEVPEDAHVPGWWAGGHAPGERGPAVIVGHVDSYEGPGIFYGLADLQAGDLVTVDREDGSTLTFAVERTEWHRKDRFPTDAVYGATDAPALRLVTCGGEFDRDARSYEENVVVFLELVDRS
jgi:hypothetical protein